jgi:four helix bundle protein
MKNDLRDRTKRFALSVIRFYVTLPTLPLEQVLGKQLLRAATSVGANYREAYRARSRAEFISKLGECLKELDETAYWLELLEESCSARVQIVPLLKETNELTAIFTTISKRTKENPVS